MIHSGFDCKASSAPLYRLLLATLLAGCASTSGDPAGGAGGGDEGGSRGEKVSQICFTGSIDNFHDPTDRSVVVTRAIDEDYLVEVGLCPQLRGAVVLGIDSLTHCLSRNDTLIVSDSARGSRRPDRCRVQAIYRWDRAAE